MMLSSWSLFAMNYNRWCCCKAIYVEQEKCCEPLIFTAFYQRSNSDLEGLA